MVDCDETLKFETEMKQLHKCIFLMWGEKKIINYRNNSLFCPKRHTDILFKCEVLVNVVSMLTSESWMEVYIHISMHLWHLNNVCMFMCVCFNE